MELREVMGRRRSIRFLLPHKPVELDKIQRMLEAARIASHWGNVNSLRAVVIERDKAPKDLFEILSNTVGGYQTQLAPVIIVWYIETAATDRVGTRLRELVGVGAIGYGPNKTTAMEQTIIPNMERAGVVLKMPGMGEIDCGQGIAQATLMAFEQGLGTCCLGAFDLDRIRRTLGLPETCRVLLSQTVGYPAEDPRAGGQRPRLPFETLFQLNGYDKPFPRNPQVVEELERDGMLQEPAPLPWREAELEYLRRALNLKGEGLVPSDQR